MPRKGKRDARERVILCKAIPLLAESGFLGTRMSDIAAATGLAMGTIYSHFGCKEDLLIACATLLAGEEQQIYRKVIQGDAPAMERIVTGFILNWLIARYHPELVEIENLSLMPSVWSRADRRRMEHLNAVRVECSDMVKRVVLEMLRVDLDGYARLSLQEQERAGTLLNHGMWALCVGLNSTGQSGFAPLFTSAHDHCSYLHFTTNVACFLKGYGWKERRPEALFEKCHALAVVCLRENIWFACPSAEEPSGGAP